MFINKLLEVIQHPCVFLQDMRDVVSKSITQLMEKVHRIAFPVFSQSILGNNFAKLDPEIFHPLDVRNAIIQCDDQMGNLPNELPEYLLSFLGLKELPIYARVCKKWLAMQRTHLEKNHTKYLATFPYDHKKYYKLDAKWDRFVENIPSLEVITEANYQLISRFIPGVVTGNEMNQKQYEIIKIRLNNYLDYYLLTNLSEKPQNTPWQLYILLSTLCKENFNDWIKSKIVLLLQNENIIKKHELTWGPTHPEAGSLGGWTIKWNEWIGGSIQVSTNMPYWRQGFAPQEIIDLSAKGMVALIRKQCDKTENAEKKLFFKLTYDFVGYAAHNIFSTREIPLTQNTVVLLLKNLTHLPKNITRLSIFGINSAYHFLFTDENALDIAEIINTNQHLTALYIDISQMSESGKCLIRESLAKSSIDLTRSIITGL